jgi:hypothetical protein
MLPGKYSYRHLITAKTEVNESDFFVLRVLPDLIAASFDTKKETVLDKILDIATEKVDSPTRSTQPFYIRSICLRQWAQPDHAKSRFSGRHVILTLGKNWFEHLPFALSAESRESFDFLFFEFPDDKLPTIPDFEKLLNSLNLEKFSFHAHGIFASFAWKYLTEITCKSNHFLFNPTEIVDANFKTRETKVLMVAGELGRKIDAITLLKSANRKKLEKGGAGFYAYQFENSLIMDIYKFLTPLRNKIS